MATIVLQAAGGFLGGAFGAVGSAIGSAAGAMAGYMIDRALIDSTKRYEGPRLRTATAFTAEDGAPLPRIYGTVRTSGTLIWATRFEEVSTTERQGGKGGPKVTTYSYFANVAFALCEGEIAGVRRIWADGREIDRDAVEVRVYRGTEDQPVDPMIEAKQGAGNAPAYRGTAYVVIERFPLDDYGRRIPQFQFEVIRPAGELNERIRSIALIPGSTEYGLATTLVRQRKSPGETEAVNRHVRFAATDLEASLDELQMLCPNLKSVSLVVSWFGNDLRAGQCKIQPMVAEEDGEGLSAPWLVSGISREGAVVVSRDESGRAAYGGTPADFSVKQAIRAIAKRGLKVALYPFIMMDLPSDNGLPDPYGGPEQAAYPWRGRITCFPAPGRPGTSDKTAAVRAQIAALAGTAGTPDFAASGDTIHFAGPAGEWSYRRFLLHYAHLAKAAGGVDAFVIGSELRGLTTLRDDQNRFPFVELLEELAGEVRAILGSGTTITYAADWSEYFGYQPADGSGDVFFHLDSLWGHPAIDAVGIDNYMPLADWRDEDAGGSNPDGFSGPYDLNALGAGIASGEGFDWYYASAEDRLERERTPITDGAYGKPWVFRYKDLVGWWSNQHFNRVGGVEEATPTAWVPKSKPIHFTELGCPAIDKGPNQPNLFPDPKSSESAVPYFSTGGRSDLAQHRFLLAHYRHWEDGGPGANPISPVYGAPMVDLDAITLWAWDARPFPAYPLDAEMWGDSANWTGGHWLNGRLSGISASDLIAGVLADHNLPPANTDMADGMLAGYVVRHPTTARAVLASLTSLFGIGVREDGNRLMFLTEGAAEGKALKLDELVLEEHGASVERIRDPDHVLPAMAHLDYTDLMNEHQSATAAIDHIGAKGTGTTYLSFPGVLSQGEANRLLRAFLRRQWDGRERVIFSVPFGEQRLGPGSIIRLLEERSDYLVDEIQDGLTRRVSARRIVRASDAPAPEPEMAGISNRSEAFILSKPHVLFLDLPMRPGEEVPQDQFRLAARTVPWRRQAVLASPESSGFALRATLDRRAVLGVLEENLPPGRVLGRIDRSAMLTVRLYEGELESVSRAQLLNGANAVAVKSLNGIWEILQFEGAEEIAPSIWRLSRLLRGQLGTDDAMQAGAANGADVVLLDEAIRPAGLRAEEIGLELNWRVGPAGSDISEENFLLAQGVSGGVRALLPLSPVHLRARKIDGDIHIGWKRRGRINADSWLGDEIPLGEERELYRIEIAPQGGAPVRTAISEEPSWTYSAAMQADDFTQDPEAIEVSVRQLSAAAGGGIAARRTIYLS